MDVDKSLCISNNTSRLNTDESLNYVPQDATDEAYEADEDELMKLKG